MELNMITTKRNFPVSYTHLSALPKIARKYGIALDVLMFGEEPKMSSYFLTRCGSGVSVERTKAYKYQSLASGFRGRKADPFIVTVEPVSYTHLDVYKRQTALVVWSVSALMLP